MLCKREDEQEGTLESSRKGCEIERGKLKLAEREEERSVLVWYIDRIYSELMRCSHGLKRAVGR
jgi:hypothetical protein